METELCQNKGILHRAALKTLRATEKGWESTKWLFSVTFSVFSEIQWSVFDLANLFGIVTTGPRIPALRTNLIVVQDGRLVASKHASEIQFHEEGGRELAEEMVRAMKHTALLRIYQEN